MKILIEIPNDLWNILAEMADELRVDPVKVMQQEIDELFRNIEAWVERGIMLAQRRHDSDVASDDSVTSSTKRRAR